MVRAGDGGAARLNSAAWLDPTDEDGLPARLARIETWYARLGLPTRFRLTPLAPPSLEPLLMHRGYGRQGETVVMTGPLDGLPLPDGSAEVAEEPDEAWFETSEAAAGRSPARLAEQRATPSLLVVPAAWITVRVDLRPVSVAFVGVDGPLAGLSWLATLPALRGQGLGRRACLAAFAWARAEGARIAWLQVEAENDAALSLYRRLGFREAYRYAYRVRA